MTEVNWNWSSVGVYVMLTLIRYVFLSVKVQSYLGKKKKDIVVWYVHAHNFTCMSKHPAGFDSAIKIFSISERGTCGYCENPYIDFSP